MPKPPQNGGNVPSIDQPFPQPPMDMSGVSRAMGQGQAPPPMDPMLQALIGGGAQPPVTGQDPMAQQLMNPPLGGAPPNPAAGAAQGSAGGGNDMAAIGQQFGPVVAASLQTPEVQQVLAPLIMQILASQMGGGPH